MTESVLVLGDYELRLEGLHEKLSTRRARRVLVQLPEGLKRYYPLISEFLKEEYGLEVHLDADPAYGPCLVDFSKTKDYDIVLNIGHDPYPYLTYPDNVLFIDLEYAAADPEHLVENVERTLATLDARRVAMLTTNQHKRLSILIKRKLTERGLNVVTGPAVLFGCYIPRELMEVKPDAVLVISGGRFHSLGLGLVLREVKVLRVDPYTRVVEEVSRDATRMLALRLEKMSRAAGARSWGIVVGVAGQYRPSLIRSLVETLESKGMRYYLFKASILNSEVLRNIDSPEVEVYVVTSCPRIAVDDLSHFEKPVLTPAEALLILKEGGVVEYPQGFLH